MKDAVSSFFLFWIYLGPALYKVYVKKDAEDRRATDVEDSYASILKQIYAKKAAEK